MNAARPDASGRAASCLSAAVSALVHQPPVHLQHVDLAWLEFEKPDLRRAEMFARDLGFAVATRTPDALYLRGTLPGMSCLVVRRGPVSRFVGPVSAAADRPDIRDLVRPHDIAAPSVGAGPSGPMAPAMQPFTAMSDDNVKVTAILVEPPAGVPLLRVPVRHRARIGGDTTITPDTVTLARGADVLVHEVIDLQIVKAARNLTPDQIQHHMNSHSDVTRVGREGAQKAGVGRLVLSHLARAASGSSRTRCGSSRRARATTAATSPATTA